MPNFFIDRFKIPPFLLPIYQAAGTEYGIRWEVLAAINEIETNYGRLNDVTSSAGAQGWMQFMPATWKAYGVDGNKDGLADPYNPVDAIFAAARYLKAAGADKDLRAAVWAYNHADWYVDSVLLRAQVIGGMPTSLVSSLTGLTEGRFPVAAKAMYADEVDVKASSKKKAKTVVGNANRNGVSIYADAGAPVVAVSDVQVTKIGVNERLGRFIQVQDAYGNTYTYGRLAKISQRYAAPKPQKVDPAEVKRLLAEAPKDKKPTRAASSTDRPGAEVDHRRGGRERRRRHRERRRRAGRPGRGQAAPVRQPDARGRRRGRRRPAGVPAHGPHRRRAHAGPRARPRARPDRHQEAQEGRAGARRHRARPHRHRVLQAAPARALRDPPGRPRRAADRPEADPRRLEAARVHGDLPRAGREPARRRRRRARPSARSC